MNEKAEKKDEECQDPTYKLLLEIFEEYGLEFTMSDAYLLRRILEDCRRQQAKIVDVAENSYSISSEALFRFLLEAYGIDFHSYNGTFRSYQEYRERMRTLAQYIRDRLRPELEML